MSNLEEAEKKIQYAEFLLNTAFAGGGFPTGSIKHLLDAANLAIKEFSKLDEKSMGSPRLVQQVLEKFEESEIRGFSNTYIRLWRLASQAEIRVMDAKQVARKVRDFVEYVKRERQLGVNFI